MKLRTALVLTALLGFAARPALAQDNMTWGLTAGLDLAKVTVSGCPSGAGSDCSGLDNNAGFTGGAFVNWPLGGMFSVMPEALYVMGGGKDTSGGGKNHIDYVQVPILARYTIPASGMVKVFIVAGPTIGLRIRAKDSSGADLKDDFKSTDVGWAIGGGVNVTEQIGFEARFGQSFSDILSDTGRSNFGIPSSGTGSDIKFKNRALTFLVDWNIK